MPDLSAAFGIAMGRMSARAYRNDPVGWLDHALDEQVWSKQADIMRAVATEPLVAVQSCHGLGKALELGTMLPTPSGWTTMGEVQVGDQLLDEHGAAVTVTAVSGVQHRPTYRMTFDDRTEFVASDNHEWQVIDLRHRPRNIIDWRDHWASTVTRTTEQIAAELRENGQYRWRVPTCRPIEGAAVTLPVPAYTLGAWLGDGHTLSAAITVGHEDVAHLLAQFDADGVRYRERPSQRRVGCVGYGFLGILAGLRELGVFGDKHVPDVVLRADVDTRLAVLQGLMDTDGFVSAGQAVGLDLTCKKLADSAAALVTSLGWKAFRTTKPSKIYGRVVGTVYRLQFRPDRPVFRLPRKAERLGKIVGQRSRHTQRTIVSVEPIETVPTKCVMVDSPTHLYLAGESMVPTHNTHLASRLIAWFLATHPVDQTMVVTTAPTSHQVRAVLWRYVRQAHEKGGLPGHISQAQVPEWKIDGNLVGYGRRPADHQQSAFQGQHAEHMLIVLDEAGGIPKWLWDAADSLMTGEDQHLLAIGNPDDNSSHFYTVCTSEPGWTKFQVSAFDTPNLTGEPVSDDMRKRLVQASWVEDKQRRWGVTSPLYQAKVLGEFVDSEDGLIPMSWVRAANARWHAWHDAGAKQVGGRRIIGVDVARYGTDDTAIAIREGDVIREIRRHSKMDTTQTTSLVAAELAFPQSVAVVDVIGVGAGVVDQLRAGQHRVMAFNAAMATKRRDVSGSWKFRNVRSASWWNLRELLDPAAGATLALPEDDDLTADLVTPQWRIGAGNTLIVESKDEIRKRLGRSTDSGDAVVQALWTNSAAGRDPGEDRPARPKVHAYAGGSTFDGQFGGGGWP